MWTELFCDNAEYLSLEIGRVIKELSRYKDALDALGETATKPLVVRLDGNRVEEGR